MPLKNEPLRLDIRRFHDGDAPALWRVYYSAIHGTASADYTPAEIRAWAPDSFDTDMWAERVHDLNPFVAEADGVVVGYADVQSNGYIDHFFVAAENGRCGVGSRLMQELHRAAAEQDLTFLFAHVSVTARGFFERWGFYVEREQALSLPGHELTNFLMRKVL